MRTKEDHLIMDRAQQTTTRWPIPLEALSAEPLVSILLSNYNYEDYIGEALDSVLTQSYRNLEVIVCDDGSSDGSAQVIERYAAADRRVVPIFKENGGQASGFNAAYAAASGEIICLMDADDLFEPEKIATAVARLRTGEHGIFLHQLLRIDKQGSAIPDKHPHLPLTEGWIAADVVARGGRWGPRQRRVPEPTTAISFRREAADLVFPIPEALRICADSFVFTLLPLLTSLAVDDENLGRYRLHGSNSYSRGFQTIETLTSDRERLLIVNEEVNRRLDGLGIDDMRIDADRNMELHELSFYIGLLGRRSRLHLVRTYAVIVGRMIRGDDLRRGLGKVAAIVMYAVAIALPPRYRLWWLLDARGGLTRAYRRFSARIRGVGRGRFEEARP